MAASLDLAGAHGAALHAILAWTPAEAAGVRRLLARAEAPAGLDDRALLARSGLLDARCEWTSLGAAVSSLLVHEAWQEGDEVQRLLAPHVRALDEAGARAAVLDVGCSTGGTLRRMITRAARVGVDVDAVALALGHRLAQAEGQDVAFRRASAHELPFEDRAFDLVVCRNAITYTHQARALAEMTRVLRPGGALLLRFENLRYDLSCVAHARSAKVVGVRVRDLLAGLVHAAAGVQLEPAGGLWPHRAFGSVRRLQRMLRRGGCRVLEVTDALECPAFLGRATQTSLVASKGGEPGARA